MQPDKYPLPCAVPAVFRIRRYINALFCLFCLVRLIANLQVQLHCFLISNLHLFQIKVKISPEKLVLIPNFFLFGKC